MKDKQKWHMKLLQLHISHVVQLVFTVSNLLLILLRASRMRSCVKPYKLLRPIPSNHEFGWIIGLITGK